MIRLTRLPSGVAPPARDNPMGDPKPATRSPSAADALLRPVDVATMLGVSPKTMERWRAEGRGPRFAKLSGKVVRYRAVDVDAFVRARSPTNES